MNRWLPGDLEPFTADFFKEPQDLPPGEPVTVTQRLDLPADAPTGAMALAIAVVDGQTGTPVVRLGIRGRADDGWYPLSRVTLVR